MKILVMLVYNYVMFVILCNTYRISVRINQEIAQLIAVTLKKLFPKGQKKE